MNVIQEDIPLGTKRLLRHLRIWTWADGLKYFNEINLTYSQWEALTGGQATEGCLSHPSAEWPRGHKLVERGPYDYKANRHKYYLTPLGEHLRPKLPPCPSRGDWPEPTESMKRQATEELEVSDMERKLLEAWRGKVQYAMPLGTTEVVEDEWAAPKANARELRQLFKKGLLEPGVAHVEINAEGNLAPIGAACPTIVYRRSPRALLSYG